MKSTHSTGLSFALIAVLAMCSSLAADTLKLKDGRVLTGTLTARRDGYLWFTYMDKSLRTDGLFSEGDTISVDVDPSTQLTPPTEKPKEVVPRPIKPVPAPPPPRKTPPAKKPAKEDPSAYLERWGLIPKKEPPLVPIPSRPVRPPVDPSDRTACARELGELATYAYGLMTKYKDKDAREAGLYEAAVGWYPYPSRFVAVDNTIRFDELLRSTHENIRHAAASVRSIALDDWRVNRFDERYGDSPEFKRQRLQQSVWAGLKAVGAMALEEELARPEVIRYYDSSGTLHEVQGERHCPIDIADAAVGEYQTIVSAWRGKSLEAEEVTRLSKAAHAQLGDEMALVWQHEILPMLERADADDTKKLWLKVQGRDKQSIDVDNPGPQDATNVLVTLEAKDDRGRSVWGYVFLPVLHAGDSLTVQAIGSAMECFRYARTVTGTVRVQTDQGSLSVAKLSMPTGQERESKAAFDRDRAAAESCESARTKRGAEGMGLVRLAREVYGTPKNPAIAAKSLKEAIDFTCDYKAVLHYSEADFQVRLSLLGLDQATGVYTASAVIDRWPERTTENMSLCGAIVEEPERGAVLILLDAKPWMPESLAKQSFWFMSAPEELLMFDSNPIRVDDQFAPLYGLSSAHIRGLEFKRTKARLGQPPLFVAHLGADGRLALQGRYAWDAIPIVPLERVDRQAVQPAP